MSLKVTSFGKECPLGKFEINPANLAYTIEPLTKCSRCSLADMNQKKYGLEEICQCPEGMTVREYDYLRSGYFSSMSEPTKEGFREFIKMIYEEEEE
jgi:hypothetical protein